MTAQLTVGDTVGYAKKFLKTIKTPATDGAWFRRAKVVAVAGDVTPLKPHWKTGVPTKVEDEYALIQWADETYPIVHDDGEQQHCHMVRTSAIAKVGSGRFAEDI